MKQGLTDITIILDRSGSMGSCQENAEEGLNAFIAEQKNLPGEATVTYVRFDTEIETVFTRLPIAEVGHLALDPRGGTALNDAIGQTVTRLGRHYEHLEEADRPEHVVLVILTDGGENASKEYTTEQVKSMLTHQQEKYNWKVTYLGANQNAFAVGLSYGLQMNNVANFDTKNIGQTFAVASAAVGNLRSGVAKDLMYSAEQRQEMVK